eukprot:471961-Rhodomonas_salina.1
MRAHLLEAIVASVDLQALALSHVEQRELDVGKVLWNTHCSTRPRVTATENRGDVTDNGQEQREMQCRLREVRT